MMRTCATLALCVLATWASRGMAEVSASRKEIVGVMRNVRDYQIANPWPFPRRQHNEWERSTFYTGVMAAYRTTKDRKYLDQAMRWAEENRWAPGPDQVSADAEACGQTYLELYLLKKDPKMIAGMKSYVDQRYPAPGRTVWYYSDALFVAPPTLARLGAATGDSKYFDSLHRMYWDATDLLFDKEEGLCYRDKSFIGQRSRNGRKVFWSRGNGWVIAGIARILEFLPNSDPQRGRYIQLLRTMAASLARQQGADGLWRASLLDPDEHPAPETSGTSFFCYSMAWGINQGHLDPEKYLPVVEKAWKGLVSSVQPSGKLGWVQGVNKQPGPVSAEDTQEYGVGAFLLADSEVVRLAK